MKIKEIFELAEEHHIKIEYIKSKKAQSIFLPTIKSTGKKDIYSSLNMNGGLPYIMKVHMKYFPTLKFEIRRPTMEYLLDKVDPSLLNPKWYCKKLYLPFNVTHMLSQYLHREKTIADKFENYLILPKSRIFEILKKDLYKSINWKNKPVCLLFYYYNDVVINMDVCYTQKDINRFKLNYKDKEDGGVKRTLVFVEYPNNDQMLGKIKIMFPEILDMDVGCVNATFKTKAGDDGYQEIMKRELLSLSISETKK